MDEIESAKQFIESQELYRKIVKECDDYNGNQIYTALMTYLVHFIKVQQEPLKMVDVLLGAFLDFYSELLKEKKEKENG